MSRRTWLLILALIIPIVGMLLSLTWGRSQPEQTMILSNGYPISLSGVTSGTKHEISFGVHWPSLARRMPGILGQYLPTETNQASQFTASPAICVWIRSPMLAGAETDLVGALSGGDGIEVVSKRTSRHQDHYCLVFHSFPSDSPTLSLRLLWKESAIGEHFKEFAPGGEFTFPNPFHGKRPALVADATPVAESEDPLITLKSLRVRPSRKEMSLPKEVYAEAVLKVEDPNNQWEVLSLTLTDRWDEKYKSVAPEFGRDGEARFRFRSFPASTEPWKLCIEYVRTANFSASEHVVFEGVPLPQRNVETETNESRHVNGHAVTLKTVHISNLERMEGSLFVEVTPHPDDLYLALVSPRKLPGKLERRMPPMHRLHFDGLDVKTGSFTAILALHKSRRGEIIARPAILPP